MVSPTDRYLAQSGSRYNIPSQLGNRYSPTFNRYNLSATNNIYKPTATTQAASVPWYAKPFQWAHEVPLVGEAMDIVGKVFDVIDYPWETYALPFLTAPFTPSTQGTEGMGWLQREQQEYKNWNSPKYVKGALELANPIWFAPEILTGGGALAARGLGTTSEIARGLVKAGEVTGFARDLPFRAAGKGLKAVGKGYEAGLGKAESALEKATGKSFEVPERTLPSITRTIKTNPDSIAEVGSSKWYRGVTKNPIEGQDTFWTTEKSIAGDYGTAKVGEKANITKLKEIPSNTYITSDKEAIASELGITIDPYAGSKGAFDAEVKAKLQSQGYDSVMYRSGTFDAGELHIFGGQSGTVKVPLTGLRKLQVAAGISRKQRPVVKELISQEAAGYRNQAQKFYDDLIAKGTDTTEALNKTKAYYKDLLPEIEAERIIVDRQLKDGVFGTGRFSLEKVPETEFDIGGNQGFTYLIGDTKNKYRNIEDEWVNKSIGSLDIVFNDEANSLTIVAMRGNTPKALERSDFREILYSAEQDAYNMGKDSIDIIGYPKHAKIYENAGYHKIKYDRVTNLFEEPIVVFRKNVSKEVTKIPAKKGFAATQTRMTLTPEEEIAIQMTDQEAKDIIEYLGKYKPARAGQFWNNDLSVKSFNKLMVEQRPLTTAEMRSLEEPLGKEWTSYANSLAKRGKLGTILDAMNAPRAIIASWDVSAPLRQGLISTLGLASKGKFSELKSAFGDMFKAFGSERNAVIVDDLIKQHPRFNQMIADGVYIAPLEQSSLTRMEEQFMSKLAEKFPMVRRSERAYITYLNKVRSEYYNTTMSSWENLLKNGAVSEITQADREGLAKLINYSTGRGSLGPLEGGDLGPLMNATLFSPRLLLSRLQWPLMIKSSSPLVRKEAARQIVAFMGMGTALLTGAGLLGAKVVMDPRSSEFGKIKIGDTRLDIWTGYAQYSRFAAQILSNQRLNQLGELSELNRAETARRFLQSKASPAAGLIYDIMTGESYMGEDMNLETKNLSKQAYNRLVPLFVQDLVDAYNAQGIGGAFTALPGGLGVGVTTYTNEELLAREQLTSEFGLTGADWSTKELTLAKQTAAPYNAISDNAWKQYPQLQAIYEQIKVLNKNNPKLAMQILAKYPMINQIRAYIASERKRMLQQNPDIQEAVTLLNRRLS